MFRLPFELVDIANLAISLKYNLLVLIVYVHALVFRTAIATVPTKCRVLKQTRIAEPDYHCRELQREAGYYTLKLILIRRCLTLTYECPRLTCRMGKVKANEGAPSRLKRVVIEMQKSCNVKRSETMTAE